MPDFEAVQLDYREEVRFIGVAFADVDSRAIDLVEMTAVSYEVYSDQGGESLSYFGGAGLPTTVFVDPSGNVEEVHTGQLSEGALRQQIDSLFDESLGSQ